jgi:hypothetical protein
MSEIDDTTEKESDDYGKLSDVDLVKIAKERYKRGVDAQSQNRSNFKADIDFAHGDQWPTALKTRRESQNQPCIEVNRLPAFINSVTNEIRQKRPSVKVRPVDDGADVEVADIYSDIIRHIESNSQADIAYDNAAYYAVAGGFGFFRVVTDYIPGTFDQDIYIKPVVNALAVVYDCDAVGLDGSDWQWCFITDEMLKEEFKREYPKVDTSNWSEASEAEGWHDKDKVRIAEYFWVEKCKETLYLLKDGTVMEDEAWNNAGKPDCIDTREAEMPCVYWAKIGGESVLERGEWAGDMIPVVPVFGDQVMVDGKRVLLSLIRFAKDAQRMLNYFRSTEAELLALAPKAPYIAVEGQIEGYEDEWGNANVDNISVLTYKQTDLEGRPAPRPQREAFAPPPTGVLQGAINASTDLMDITGIHESNLGKRSNEQSGRAIMARQAEGDNATYHFSDNQTRAIKVLGRLLVGLIPNIYDSKRLLRLRDQNDNERVVTVNAKTQEKDEYGRTVNKFYDLTAGTYDVTVTAGASFGSRRQESVEQMGQILQQNPDMFGVFGDLFVKAQDWPNAEEIAERIKKTIPPQILPPEPEEGAPEMPPEVQMQMQQMQEQMQQMDAALQQAAQSHQELQSQLDNKQAELVLKEREVQVKEYEAETHRLAAMKEQNANNPNVTDAELSEADRLEIEIAKMKYEIDAKHQHDMRMAKMHHAHSQMAGNELVDSVDEDGNPVPSELAQMLLNMAQTQQAATALLQQNTQQVADLARIIAAPKELIRDAEGRPVGSRSIL